MRRDRDSPRDSAFRVRVTGAVQGVGFRPFVHALATSLSLAGRVRNDPLGVEIVVEGPAATLETFLQRLVDDAPPLSLVEEVTAERIEPAGTTGFSIVESSGGAHTDTYVTADAATCPDCLRELFDPSDRRYRYPFINCTACGPRYTITRAVPYDRASTTMASFRMCPECQSEYDDPSDRRFHAQPNACPVCGPRLAYHTAAHATDTATHTALPTAARPDAYGEAALAAAVDVLLDGGILAVKGLGGYHLACDATRETSVATLRRRKHRDERPFAVMVGTLEEAAAYCSVSRAEGELLSSPRRPIVLLDHAYPRPASADEVSREAPASAHDTLAPSVAPGVDTYGFFLPYTPLHRLLLHAVGRPLVMTSGNVSDEPIAFEDHDAFSRLLPLADGFLTHDRPIHVRVDDSVARLLDARPYLLRRSRGWAPLPVSFPGSDTCILAVGGHLKNTFVVTRGRRAFVSQHIGDLENLETLRTLEEGVAHLQRLFDLRPAVVAHDLHPDYLSTRFAARIAAEGSLTIVGVQHHEAHVASVMADAGHPGPVVGVAFDGTGYGTDGTVWGGEFFVGSPGAFTRVARLGRLPLPGGEAAIREPWRLGLALLQVCGIDPQAALAPLATNGVDTVLSRPWEFMERVITEGVNTPLTSSVGRLFDAAAALLSLRLEASYEGQAAILLETAASRHFATTGLPSATTTPDWLARDGWPMATRSDLSPRVIPLAPFAHALVDDLARGDQASQIAARFHHALAWVTAEEAAIQAAHHSLDTVALGGGVFQNMLLVRLLMDRLRRLGLDVLTHRNVPTNDGGLSLGQAAIAAAVLWKGVSASTDHGRPSVTSTTLAP